jgi:outer membrane protein assembly factor BamA
VTGRPARRGRTWPALFAGLLLFLAWPSWAADENDPGETGGIPAIALRRDIITAIEFSGNAVTRERILRQEMLVTEGDPADPSLIERSRQAIMDLGLFTWVRARLVPQEQGSVLHITVKEKYYILPVPKLDRDDDGNFSLGAEVTMDNLAGLNQQLKLRYENEDADGLSGGKRTTYSLGYYYPRLYGSPYLLRGELSQARSPAEEVSGTTLVSLYRREAWIVAAQLSRWLALRGPSRGWQAGGGLVWRRNNYDYISGAADPDYHDAQAVGATVLVQFLDTHDYLFSRSGIEYGYHGEYGTPVLGSDRQYSRHELFYRRFVLLQGRAHENIDMQFRLGLSSGDMFDSDATAYSIGGFKALRGFPSGSFAGNSYALFNIQYLRPLFGYNPFRGVVFADIGNAYPSNNELHLGDVKWDVGVGLRLRLKAFVKIDLRVDAAYAPETGEFRYFAGSKEMF